MHSLSDSDRARYAWQLSVADFGEAGQAKLKNSTVLISRCGGVGGTVAYQVAAAGVGRIILAHAGNLEAADLNRQLLMNEAGVGSARVEQAAQRMRAFNPSIEIVPCSTSTTNVLSSTSTTYSIAAASSTGERASSWTRVVEREEQRLSGPGFCRREPGARLRWPRS